MHVIIQEIVGRVRLDAIFETAYLSSSDLPIERALEGENIWIII
jgi:hypothetical protein